MPKKNFFLFLIPLYLLVSALSWAGDSPLKKASLIPQWVPQAQFAGYYMALEKGIYKRHGIDLTIIPGGPSNPPSDLLISGKAQFATMWLSTGIQMRDSGSRIINLAQLFQRSALMLVAKKSSGINTPREINGSKVGVWGPVFQIQPKAFFRKYNLKVKLIPQSYSINLFLRDGVDVASAMWYNEYHTILNSGLNQDELTTFFFHEHGLNFPEDGIYTLNKTFQRDPGLCRSFTEASLEGWKYAFSHTEETLDLIMRNLKMEHIPATRVHQKWMLERMRDLILPKDSHAPMGRLLREDYDRVARALMRNGLIKEIPDFRYFCGRLLDHDEK